MKKENKWLVFKIVMISILLALFLAVQFNESALSMVASIITVMAVVTFIRYKKPDAYMKDERINKLSAYASSWSWIITLFIVTMMFWLQYLDYISLTGIETISVVFFVMISTIIVFRIYFIRKGDI